MEISPSILADPRAHPPSIEPPVAVTGEPPPRLLGDLGGARGGPTLIAVGALHGNEPAGLLAIERVVSRLAGDGAELPGRLVALAGNRRALGRRRRYLDCDLNRLWLPPTIARARAATAPLAAEEEELRELAAELERVLATAGDEIFLLDLHTTSGPGPAFTVLDDTLPNRRLAAALGAPLVLGLEEELVGTLSHYLSTRGVVAVGFEAGQHQDPGAVDRAEAALWLALAACRVVPPERPEVAAARERVARANRALPRVVEVRYRHDISPDDEFRIASGLAGFQRVDRGQVLAHDRRGPVTAPEAGLLLMPLYQAQGDDGFFLTRRVHPLWLRLSSFLRRLRLERYLHWLPGVHRHPEQPGKLLIDRRIARWRALEIFHLLGFSRRRAGGRFLVMSRRAHDRFR